jgi:putative intracellular protease/amidase
LHPFIKSVVKGCIGTDEKAVIDGNIYTAQTENAIPSLLPELLKVLK